MSDVSNTSLETLFYFSDYQNDKIKYVQMNLENNMCLVVSKDERNANGVTITLKDTITDSIEVSGFIKQDNLKSLIKILNIMYRQSVSNSSGGSLSCNC